MTYGWRKFKLKELVFDEQGPQIGVGGGPCQRDVDPANEENDGRAENAQDFPLHRLWLSEDPREVDRPQYSILALYTPVPMT